MKKLNGWSTSYYETTGNLELKTTIRDSIEAAEPGAILEFPLRNVSMGRAAAEAAVSALGANPFTLVTSLPAVQPTPIY